MDFMRKFDLNFVSRAYEWLAIISFVLGIIVSIYISIKSSYFGTTIVWEMLITGICYTIGVTLFFLFLSRTGDALDDIRNKLCYPEDKETIVEE